MGDVNTHAYHNLNSKLTKLPLKLQTSWVITTNCLCRCNVYISAKTSMLVLLISIREVSPCFFLF